MLPMQIENSSFPVVDWTRTHVNVKKLTKKKAKLNKNKFKKKKKKGRGSCILKNCFFFLSWFDV